MNTIESCLIEKINRDLCDMILHEVWKIKYDKVVREVDKFEHTHVGDSHLISFMKGDTVIRTLYYMGGFREVHRKYTIEYTIGVNALYWESPHVLLQ